MVEAGLLNNVYGLFLVPEPEKVVNLTELRSVKLTTADNLVSRQVN